LNSRLPEEDLHPLPIASTAASATNNMIFVMAAM